MTKQSANAGFTLIEIVIAVSILAIIMSVAYSSLSQIILTKQALDDSREIKSIVNSILIRMTREIQLARAGFPIIPPCGEEQRAHPPRVNLIGEPSQTTQGLSSDRITFIAAEGGQFLPDGSGHSGDVQITYRVEQNPEQKDSRDQTYYLVREELPYLTSYKKACQQAMVFPITENLLSLKFRYYDSHNNKWVNHWGSNPYFNLPIMVEFEMKIRSKRGTVQAFKTAVALRSHSDT